MKVLLVEDDEDKRGEIIDFIRKYYNWDLTEVRSFRSASKKIINEQFDLILLDMTIPTFDICATESGGRIQAFGGELILYEILRREIVSKVIVITQFDIFGENEEEINLSDLDLRLQERFPKNYLGAVQYKISYTNWEQKLISKINNEFNK